MMAGFDHHSVRVVAIRKRALTLVLKLHLLLARIVMHCLQSKRPSYPPLRTSLRRRRKKLSHLLQLKYQTLSVPHSWTRHLSVVGVVDGQTTSGLSGPVEKKPKKAESKKSTSTSAKPARSEKSVKSSSNRPPTTSTTDQGKSTTSSTDSRISDLDRKWSDRFNRLEAC